MEDDHSPFRWRRGPLGRGAAIEEVGGTGGGDMGLRSRRISQRGERSVGFLKKRMHAACTKIRQNVISIVGPKHKKMDVDDDHGVVWRRKQHARPAECPAWSIEQNLGL